jgi:hypothetical protein
MFWDVAVEIQEEKCMLVGNNFFYRFLVEKIDCEKMDWKILNAEDE